MKFWHNVSVVAVLIFISFSNCLDAAFQWHQTSYAGTTVYFTLPDSLLPDAIFAIQQKTISELKTILGPFDTAPFSYYIAPDKKTFRKMTGNRIPEWSEAVTRQTPATIFIKSPLFSKSRRNFAAVIRHELTHIVLFQQTKGNVAPTWLHEGLAVKISGEAPLTDNSLLSKAALTRSFIPLSRIDAVFSFHTDKALLAYQESFSFVSYLLKTLGPDVFAVIVPELAHGRNLDEIFSTNFATSMAELETDWRLSLETRRFDFLFNFSSWFWPALSILFLATVITIYWQNKRRIKSWEEEEDDQLE